MPAIALRLWERDQDGTVLYEHPVRPTRRFDPIEAKVIRLADRLSRGSAAMAAGDTPPVPANVLAAITASVEITTTRMRDEMPDVSAAVKTGIAETFAMFDVDLTDRASIDAFKRDLRFSRSWREATSRMWGHAQLVFTGVLVVAIVFALWSKMSPPTPTPIYAPPVNPATGRP